MLTRSSWRLILALLLLAALTAWSAFLYSGDDRLHVYLFDVGQGDSILVKLHDFEILVDGGPDSTIVNHLGSTLPPWDRTIELVILTHPHADHVTGLVDVLERYDVGTVWGTGVIHTSDVYLSFFKKIQEKGIQYQVVKSGDRLENHGLAIDVMYPKESFAQQRLENVNLSSIVTMITYEKFRILLTGDAEEPIQEELVTSDADLTAHVLKVPHQGSRDADLPTFLEKVRPLLAVLSVGTNNRYGHPHEEVIQRYEALKISLVRTDRDGTIHLTSDGQAVWMRTEKTGIVSEMMLEDARVGSQ